MTTDTVTDIAILGAGPAGTTAARLLASWGRRVVLLSRAGAGHALAESLPPSAVRTIERLGVESWVERASPMRATGNTAWWAGGEPRIEHFADGETGLQVERAALDRALLDAAIDAGVHAPHALVRDVKRLDDDTWSVATDGTAGAATLRARWVLDCTGRAGVLARRGFRRVGELPRTTAFVGVWEHDRWEIADPSHTLVESFADGWAWSVPLSPTRRYVTAMVDRQGAVRAQSGELAAAYARAIDAAPEMKRLAQGARLARAPWARDASVYDAGRRGEIGVLLVGDAAAFSDPLSSFGVKKALASARLAAVVAHSALDDGAIAGEAVELFTARERAMSARLAEGARAMAAEACAAHGGDFWSARASAPPHDAPGLEPRIDRAATRAAYDELRARGSTRLQLTDRVSAGHVVDVRGTRIVREPALVSPSFPSGVRWWGNVDLVALAPIAAAHDDVIALWEAYNRGVTKRDAPAIDLPELLAALAAMIAAGVMRFA